MNEGARVVRVSLRSDEGTIGDVGTVRRRYNDDEGQPQGYYVEWDATGAKAAHMSFVAPVRIVTIEAWQADQKARPAA